MKTVTKNAMLLCLDKNYNMYLNDNDRIATSELQSVIDSLLNLLQSYGVDDEEIIDYIKEDTDLDIEEVEE